MHVHADVATKLASHLLVNREAVAVGNETVGGRYRSAVFIHRREGTAEHIDAHHLLLIACNDGHLLRKVLRGLHKEGGSKSWHLQGELTFIIGHGNITHVVENLDTHT